MSLSDKWRSTERPEGPKGYKRSGTFRDISLVGVDPEDIDEIDAACMESGLSRSDYVLELLSTWKGDMEFNRIFDGTKYADKFWPEIDKTKAPLLGWDRSDIRSLRRMGYWRNRPLYREPSEHDWGEEACTRAYFLLKKEGIDPYGWDEPCDTSRDQSNEPD